MMVFIYKRARCVIAWLGCWTERADMALRFMKGTLIYWHDLIPEVTKHLDGSFWMNGDFRLGTFGNAKSLSMTAPQKTAGFVDFCSLEYWQRTWII